MAFDLIIGVLGSDAVKKLVVFILEKIVDSSDDNISHEFAKDILDLVSKSNGNGFNYLLKDK